ncbi:MAG: arginine--tRNA ligase [Planctomycetota bacterium]|jgi:arginyl-tRNA synthetase
MNLRHELERRISQALTDAGAPADTPALVGPAAKPEFGDYQANGVMAAAKQLKTNPRELAEKVIAAVDLSDLAETVEVAGPGFINITLRSEWLTGQLNRKAADSRLGVDEAQPAQTVVVDYSSPNLAKEMHVGHLRSTIIGDALARTLEFLGHKVKRQNHVGDWGTQFGMLTAYLDEISEVRKSSDPEEVVVAKLGDLEEFYRAAKGQFDTDESFANKSREFVVKLQGGDEDIGRIWLRFVAVSLMHCQQVYDRLGVQLTYDDVCGESFYNNDLADVLTDLAAKGLLRESQGAQCVFLDELKNKDGEITPFLVQKSDGGYLYATTDLAAVRHRVGPLGGERLLYVTDARQAFHFKQLFATAKAAGFAPESASLEHVPFGMMLGDDRRPFKTREGGTIKLMDLLDEAVRQAGELVADKNPDLSADEQAEVARVVGLGAVKYADLSQNRTSDYVFSWDRMLSLEGNTAPYMQYAYARIRSIFRKGEVDETTIGPITLAGPAERALAVKLLQLTEAVQSVADDCMPNVLCQYLYELAGAFMSFYESCPVLPADEPVRSSRLALCDLTARTIKQGLELLGIETIERM